MRIIDRRHYLTGMASVAAATMTARDATCAPLEPRTAADVVRSVRPPLRVGFRRIFDPSLGESEPWYINDHCFVRAEDGLWHMFGITHREPAAPLDEIFFAHATARDLWGPWRKLAPIMHADRSAGETHVWAPFVLRHDGRYWMYYCAGGEDHTRYRIHLATSHDLHTWARHPANPMLVDGYDARDPMVLRVGDEWVLYYAANEPAAWGAHVVAAVTSRDLIHWSGKRIVFRSHRNGTYGGPTESPYVVARDGLYYLFVCTNEPYNDTAVYVSNSPFDWSPANLVMRFPAHAAEVINDEDGRWYASSAGWNQGGLYLAELAWEQPLAR